MGITKDIQLLFLFVSVVFELYNFKCPLFHYIVRWKPGYELFRRHAKAMVFLIILSYLFLCFSFFLSWLVKAAVTQYNGILD